MKTILEFHGYKELTTDQGELKALANEEAVKLLNAGDFLGAGEWYLSSLACCRKEEIETILAKVISLWASSQEAVAPPEDLQDLLGRVHEFAGEGRILCYVLCAFLEAQDRIRRHFPKVQFVAAKMFGEDVRALDPEAGIFDNQDEINFARDMLVQIGRELTPQNPIGMKDLGALVCFHNTAPNNTLPIFWSNGKVNERPWKPLFPRA